MDITHNIIVLLDAVKTPDVRSIVAVGGRPMDAMRQIAQVLDWRLDPIDAVRTNLNDLEAYDSPLSQMVRYAGQSALRHFLIIQEAAPAMLGDENQLRRLAQLAVYAPVILCMDDMPAETKNWVTCDLR